jgi:hypothetical protein
MSQKWSFWAWARCDLRARSEGKGLRAEPGGPPAAAAAAGCEKLQSEETSRKWAGSSK